MAHKSVLTLLLIALSALPSFAIAGDPPATEILYLSGTGYRDTVDWEFYCTAGRRSGQWTTIPVPSQWELQGFGSYNYGHDEDKSREQGRYRHRFRLPESWRGRTIDLVFEGVMTDAEVELNGRSAGPRHQGGFYRFHYEITDLLDFDGENLLAVEVSKHSADRSVNRAERDADYWVFGGIYRPVYLRALPAEAIDHFAVDARHDGSFRLRATLRGVRARGRLEARILTREGQAVGEPFAVGVKPGQATAELGARVRAPRPWSAESPELYQVEVRLIRSGQVLHRERQRFGFRTIAVRPGEGLYVNGRRVLLKGVNRHAFWPSSGRTLDRDLDRADAALIKAMNMNAVRASHYPPDPSLLDACDELGVYVVDELAGWHDAYDTAIGRRLVAAMVRRDVNHPAVILWSNGNEGGWNPDLDEVFAEHDLQQRPLLHPGDVAFGVDARHYPDWSELSAALDPASRWSRTRPLVLPTELLHGLYDGGSGAGLEDYWRALRRSPLAGGAFLWSFSDESVVRADRGGALDSDGNHAPDGILGPYREKTGNFYAVRALWSPIAVDERLLGEAFDGTLEVGNRYDMTDLAACRFTWALVSLPGPDDPRPAVRELAAGELAGPPVPPGGRGRLVLPLPAAWADADGLRLAALDPFGREVGRWVLPKWGRRRSALTYVAPGAGSVEARTEGRMLVLRAGPAEVEFDSQSGELRGFRRGARRLSLAGPLRPAAGERPEPSAVRHGRDGSGYLVDVRYRQGLHFARWKLFPSGWLRLNYQYSADPPEDYRGIALPYPEEKVRGVVWLGDGPARVWQNRLRGGVLGVWEKRAGEPELRGYYGNVRWARLATAEGDLTLVLAAEDLYLGLFSPAFPPDARHAVAAVPPSGITVLNAVAPIGTKFHPAAELGPQGQRHRSSGLEGGAVWLCFGGCSPGADQTVALWSLRFW